MARKKTVKTTKVTKKVSASPKIEQNKNNFILLLSVVALLTLGLYYAVARMTPNTSYAPSQTATEPARMYMDIIDPVVVLNEQNNSGEYGNVTLTEKDGNVVVSVMVNNAPRGVAQPAHIHAGSCIALGDVVYPMTNVVNGKSETTLKVTMDELKNKMPLSINVHKSAAQANVYVSCGNLEMK